MPYYTYGCTSTNATNYSPWSANSTVNVSNTWTTDTCTTGTADVSSRMLYIAVDGRRRLYNEPRRYPAAPRPAISHPAEDELAERKRRRAVAHDRGMELLRSILSDREFELYRERRYIDVLSPSDPGKAYRIRPGGRRIGVLRREGGVWRELPLSLCVHPPDQHRYVEGDNVASLMLLAAHNEALMNRIANVNQCAA